MSACPRLFPCLHKGPWSLFWELSEKFQNIKAIQSGRFWWVSTCSYSLCDRNRTNFYIQTWNRPGLWQTLFTKSLFDQIIIYPYNRYNRVQIEDGFELRDWELWLRRLKSTGCFIMNTTKVFLNDFYSKAPYELKLVPYFHWYPDILIESFHTLQQDSYNFHTWVELWCSN